MDNIERQRSVIYILDSAELGYRELRQEPDGWDVDTKSWKREAVSKAIPSKTEIALKFYGDGADYLHELANVYGDVKCRLIKTAINRSSLEEEYEIKYIQELKITSLKSNQETGEATIESITGGLYQDIETRKSEEYDLINPYSADGINIGDLKTYRFTPVPRNILRNSLIEADDHMNFVLKSGRWSNQRVDAYAGIPMEIVHNSHPEDLQNVLFNPGDSSRGAHNMSNLPGTPQRVGDQFFLRADRRLVLDLKFRIKFRITDISENDADDKVFKIQFRVSQGENIELDTIQDLRTINNPNSVIGQTITVDWTRNNFVIEEGQSLSIVYYSQGDYDGSGGNNRADYYITAQEAYIEVSDQTGFGETTSKCITMFDAFNRIASKITGRQNLVRSSLFGIGGELEDVIIDNGFWARQFPDSYIDANTEEERITQLVTSWEDCFKSAQYWRPLTWFTRVEGNQEYIYVEDARYTQNNFIGIDLGEVDSVKTEITAENFFKSLEFGMEQELDYEEINGLDEYNGLAKYSTYRDRSENIYQVITPYRIDSTGYELTRRKNFKNYATEDTSRDEHIWMHDARLVNNVYTHNTWREVCSAPPKGIFDPDSAWNLRLSPANRMFYGHSYAFNCALFHFQNKKIWFKSSNCNSNLITFVNGRELRERGDYKVSNLEPPLIVPRKIILEFNITDEIMTMLEGGTEIEIDGNFVEIPNIFGQIRAVYRGEEYYGRLLEVKTGDESSVQLIEINV